MSKRSLYFSCAECPILGKVFCLDTINDHYRDKHYGLSAFKCGVCGLALSHKTSMIRHIKTDHEDNTVDLTHAAGASGPSEISNVETYNAQIDDSNDGFDNCPLENSSVTNNDDVKACLDTNPYASKDLKTVAGEVIMSLRSTGRVTSVAIERFLEGYEKLMDAQTSLVKHKLFSSLKAKGMSDADIVNLLEDAYNVGDPFTELNTTDKQLEFYESRHGLVRPLELFLSYRIDNRLDPKTNQFVPTQVTESFQYVSIIETLKLILSNKSTRNNIFKDVASTDGVLRSFLDGHEFQNHPLLTKYENVLHICLFYDDLEIAAALGSKTIIHKLGVFFFQILNGPAHLKSKLSSIQLLALAYSEDMKKPGAYQKVLFSFIQEMKKLSSENGVQMEIDGAPFTLRAVLVTVSADTLAAHELLGFLSPAGARHFCRVCMIDRRDFRLDGNLEAPLRTRASHDQQVAEVLRQPKLSTKYGVKAECCLNDVPFFHCVEGGSVFDAFHDILEGVVPLVIKLVLRNIIYIRELMTIFEFNVRVASFSYGIPDANNRPSPNFTIEMLSSHKRLKQTGTQMWCLMRALPFLLADCVPESDDHLEICFMLQNIMKIVFSFEAAPQDLDLLDTLVYRFIDMFKALFIDIPQGDVVPEEIVEEEELTEEGFFEEEEEVEPEEGQGDDRQPRRQRKKKKTLKVYFFNKIHHLKHYSGLIRKLGPIVRLWCAKFEASLKIFRQYAAICCNFKNSPKTMAQMFQLSHLWSLLKNEDETTVDFQAGSKLSADASGYPQLFAEAQVGEFVDTNKATVNGEEYRPGLFVALNDSQLAEPKFSLISQICVVEDSSIFLLLESWKVVRLSNKYNAYEVVPHERPEHSLQSLASLKNFRPIAPWTDSNGVIYLAPRTQVL